MNYKDQADYLNQLLKYFTNNRNFHKNLVSRLLNSRMVYFPNTISHFFLYLFKSVVHKLWSVDSSQVAILKNFFHGNHFLDLNSKYVLQYNC